MTPPRFLWVPFELGRPLGVPDDAAFQSRVLHATLNLFNAKQGPVLEDFPEDAPTTSPSDMTGAVCPIPLPPPTAASETDLAAQVEHEIAQLAPWYELAMTQRGRTTVGISGIEPLEAGKFLSLWLDGTDPESYEEGLPLGQALKLASEDLKAYYLEATTSQPGAKSTQAVAQWFWNETAAGQLLRTIHPICVKSDDPSVRAISQRGLIPRMAQHTP